MRLFVLLCAGLGGVVVLIGLAAPDSEPGTVAARVVGAPPTLEPVIVEIQATPTPTPTPSPTPRRTAAPVRAATPVPHVHTPAPTLHVHTPAPPPVDTPTPEPTDPPPQSSYTRAEVEQAIRDVWTGDDDKAVDVADCESHLNPKAVSSGGTYRGLWQFTQGTWEAWGGSGDPIDATPHEQTRVALNLYNGRGWSPWGGCA